MHSGWPGTLARRCLAVTVATAALTLTACGSGSTARSPASPSQHPVTPGSAQPTAGAAAVAAIRGNWERLFTYSRVSLEVSIGLIEDGEQFRRYLKTRIDSATLQKVSARVSKVVLVPPAAARVTYTIFDSGKPILPDQPGISVYQDGVWKVSKQTLCRLLLIQGGGSASLPAPCRASN